MTSSPIDFDFPDENDFATQILKGLDDNCSVKSESSSRSLSLTLTESPFPDRRNVITKMFEDCLNSGDPEYVREVLTPVLDESCDVESYRLTQIGIIGSEELENTVVGRDAVVPYFMGYVISIPDIIFLIHEWKLFQRSGGISCLMFKFTLTGNQIVPHESKCNIEDNFEEPAATESSFIGKKREYPDNSIKFKAITYQGRDRKKKQKTIGEFVTGNRIYDKHITEIESLLEDVEADDPQNCDEDGCSSDEDKEKRKKALASMGLQSSIKINMRGVMRLHFDEKNQIYKIHCVHFVSH